VTIENSLIRKQKQSNSSRVVLWTSSVFTGVMNVNRETGSVYQPLQAGVYLRRALILLKTWRYISRLLTYLHGVH